MALRKIRRIGRVFAIALLAWTAIDLVDRHACQNEGVLPAVVSPAACGCLADARGTAGQAHQEAGALAGHAGDCFCCSAFVDIRTPFHLFVTSTGVWLHPPPGPLYVSVSQAHLYRPPIAA